MRDFKFCAWHKERNKMLNVFGVNFRTQATVQALNDQFELYEELLSCVSLMQFTGLKDINGKDIYEGDIIHQHSVNLEVKFIVDGWFAEDSDESITEAGQEWESSCHVIGNIYENQDLLVRE